MIQFPETAHREWQHAEAKAQAAINVRRKIEREARIANEVETLRVRHEARLIFQQELDAADTPTLEMASMADYLSNPASAPNDLIEGVMKENGLTIVLGPSGSGKSTLALQMLFSLQTGQDWLYQKVQQISGGIGFLSYDMDAGMAVDWMAGFPGFDHSRVHVVNAYKRGHPLGVPAHRQAIIEAWKKMNVEVVVLDSFSASFFGHDQNDAAATMAHYRDLKLFALTEVGAKALIVVTHSTDNNPLKARGSTVHKDTADSMVAVVPDPQTGRRTVQMEKYREARGQSTMEPRIVTAPDAVTHLVDVDLGEMSLAGMSLPVGATSALFPALPETEEAPDTDSTYHDEVDEDSEEDDDL